MWRRERDSNPRPAFGLCRLQIAHCRECRDCQNCQRSLHAVARRSRVTRSRPGRTVEHFRSDSFLRLGLKPTAKQMRQPWRASRRGVTESRVIVAESAPRSTASPSTPCGPTGTLLVVFPGNLVWVYVRPSERVQLAAIPVGCIIDSIWERRVKATDVGILVQIVFFTPVKSCRVGQIADKNVGSHCHEGPASWGSRRAS